MIRRLERVMQFGSPLQDKNEVSVARLASLTAVDRLLARTSTQLVAINDLQTPDWPTDRRDGRRRTGQ